MTPRPLTICHIILRLDFGGLENGLVMLINHLPAEHYRHVIVCLEGATDFRRRIRRSDVTIFEMHRRPGKDLRLYRRIWRLLRDLRPDVIHTRNLPTVDMLLPAAMAGGAALVHSEHGLDLAESAAQQAKYMILRRLSRLVVDRYLAVSQDLAGWLESRIGIPRDKIAVIYNGVDSDRFHPRRAEDSGHRGVLPTGFAHPGAFIVGTVGRLEPIKDQVNLVRAFLQAIEQRPVLRRDLRLVVIGDGSLRPELTAILEQAQATGLAWMPGFLDQTADIYRALDLFVLPSRGEGTSNTILEAMASGLPVVATSVGGNPNLVTEGITGRLLPAEQPAALASAIVEYAEHPRQAATHGAAGRERVLRDFSIAAMVKGYGALYQSVVPDAERNIGSER